MTARASRLARVANGMKAMSAAGPRNGAKEYLTAEKNRGTSETAWTGEYPMERRMQSLPSVARFRLMRPPATLSRVATQDWLAGVRANQRAVLISAANAASCLPSNRYMDSNTTSTI